MTAKSDVLVKMILVFFISLLSFSIGTFVGKKYSDNQHKLASLEPESKEGNREVASEGGEKGEKKEGGERMSDSDISKLAEEFADDGNKTAAAHEGGEAHGEAAGENHGEHAEHGDAKHGEEHVAASNEHAEHGEAKHETAKHEAPARHGEEASPVAKNVAAGHEPVAATAPHKTEENRLPSSLPKDVAQYSVGKFTVQIGAFNNEPEAKKRAEDLKSKGYSAFYVPADVKGHTWYRVSVGLFATEKEAKDYRTEFMSKTKTDKAFIQKIVQ